MAKDACISCNARVSARESFCAACGRPTRYASDQELLDYDLKSWREHVDRSVADGTRSRSALYVPESATGPGRPSTAPARAIRVEQPVAQPVGRTVRVDEMAEPAPKPAAARRTRAAKPRRAKARRAISSLRRVRLPKAAFRRDPADRVISLDSPFAYSSCTECGRTDWLVRTKHNEDETWMYWCVRCSRSFKTEVRLSNAAKPFVAAGSVLGLLVTASQLMLR